MGIGLLAASVVALSPLEANATRVEYYATVGEPLCEMNFARSGLGFCDLSVGSGVQAPRGELINVSFRSLFGFNSLGLFWLSFSSNRKSLLGLVLMDSQESLKLVVYEKFDV